MRKRNGSNVWKRMRLCLVLVLFAGVFAFHSGSAEAASVTGEQIVDYAKSLLGKAYKEGGQGPDSFDNWAFTRYVYGKFGVELKQSVYGQSRQGKYIRKGEPLQAGDLVFFGYDENRVVHVGIYAGNGQFIDAYRYSGKVAIHNMDGIYKTYYLGARRVLDLATDVQPSQKQTSSDRYSSETLTSMQQRIIKEAMKYLGVDYKLGAEWENDRKFDCSSFTQQVYRDVGISIPRTVTKQMNATRRVYTKTDKDAPLPLDVVQVGDLITMDTDFSGGSNHIGIYIGDGKIIHASTANGGKVQITDINNSRYWRATVQYVHRVL